MKACFLLFLLLFSSAALADSDAKPKILFLGSSSVEFWSSLATDFPTFETVNLGKGGTTYTYVVENARSWTKENRPEGVVLYSGDNDVASGQSPARIADNFERAVRAVRAGRADANVYVISIKPSPSRADKLKETAAANEMIFRSAERLGVTFVDVYSLMLDEGGQPRAELFREDRLHMNARGYEIWARALAPKLPARLPASVK